MSASPPRPYRILCCVLAITSARPAHGQAAPQTVAVVVTPADAMILAREALDRAPLAFAVELQRIQLFPPQVRIQVSVAGSCALTLDGTPALEGGRIAFTHATEYREGWTCRAVPALNPQPWDLAERLERASCDPALPGPRLPSRSCLAAGAVQLTSISVGADGLHAVVRVASP